MKLPIWENYEGDIGLLGDRLRYLREQRDLGQKEAAESLGISGTVLSRYESGARTPDTATLVRLARFYGVTTDYLLGTKARGADPEDEEWRELMDKIRTKGMELEATALLRASGKLSKTQLRNLLSVFEMIEADQQEK